jgi:calcineurin-like phosphoesterase family protein
LDKDTGCEDVEWIQLAQDRVQWQHLVSIIMNSQITVKTGDFLYQLGDYQLLRKATASWTHKYITKDKAK